MSMAGLRAFRFPILLMCYQCICRRFMLFFHCCCTEAMGVILSLSLARILVLQVSVANLSSFRLLVHLGFFLYC